MIEQTVNSLFNKTKQDWLNEARAVARKQIQECRTTTIEDVLEVCRLPNYLHRNTIGSVFQDSDFTPVGYVASRRAISHGRTIRRWALKSTTPTQRYQYLEIGDVA